MLMKNTLVILAAAFLSMLPLIAQKPSEYVNPMIGTDGMGHTFPGACVPFGGVQLSPDTDNVPHNIDGVYQKATYKYCAGYQYSDSTIVGFSHTHFSGTGHSDLGDILLMPSTGEVKLDPGTAQDPDSGYRSRFSHENEKAAPGYYEVLLSDSGVKAQLTATSRVGVHKYTFPKNQDAHVILDLGHGIYNYDGKVLWSVLRVENDTLITGYRITNGWARTNYTYFAISFSKPITEYGYKERDKLLYKGFWRRFKQDKNFPEIAGKDVAAYFHFDTKSGEELVAKVALSAVSTEGALKNLKAEAEGKNFEQLVAQAQESWNKELSMFSVEGTEDQKAMFYTSLYHTMINPSVYMDVDGSYRGLDHNIHKADDFVNYTVFSLWDTYRAEHPLMNIIQPKRSADMVASMIAHQQQSVHGMLPIWSHMGNENWCMSGYHAVSVLSDAMAKGVYGASDDAFNAMVSTSTVPYYAGLGEYMELGYVPMDKVSTAASTTLEYAYDDWTIYSAAKKAGREDIAQEYMKRALYYRNLYDRELGFARPRYSDGSFKKEFDVLQTHGEGFIEGNSWNFSFHVPFDVNGLMSLMGGEKVFVKRLDDLFGMHLPEEYYAANEDITIDCLVGGYVHGNEPSHHVPYLYAWTSQPWKTQYWLRDIMNRMYRNDIRGLGGNDDCGQMSAWYIFSAMGFYPVCPGSDQYVLGAPYMPYIKLDLSNGKSLVIKAEGVGDRNRYVKALYMNGKKYDKNYVTHEDILAGGEWKFVMDAKPNKKRGVSAEAKPYSLTDLEIK
jgi:predicted alpha-1,2-mannosidase